MTRQRDEQQDLPASVRLARRVTTARQRAGRALRASLDPRWEPVHVVGLFGLALAVRLAYNFTAAGQYRPTYDAALYDMIARNLLHRHCYCLFGAQPTASRAPLWPWIMSVIYAVLGEHNLYPRLFYCLLGSCTCLIIYRFARDLFGKRAATVAALVCAVYTGLFLYDGWLYTESLFTFCVTGFTYALYRMQSAAAVGRARPAHAKPPGGARMHVRAPLGFRRPAAALALPGWMGRTWHAVERRRWAIACGVCAGAASLTRPNGLALLGVIGIWCLVVIRCRLRPWPDVLRDGALAVMIAVALVVPWTYRNFTVAHAPVLVETGLGEVLLGAYNDQKAVEPWYWQGMWRMPQGTINHDDPRYTPETDAQYTARAITWITSHPLMVPYLWGLHLVAMWTPYNYAHGLAIEEYPDRLSSRVLWALIYLESIPVFLLAALGLWATYPRWRRALVPVYLVLGVTVIENMALYSTMRFRAPIEPLLVLLVAGLVASGLPRLGAVLFGWKRVMDRRRHS